MLCNGVAKCGSPVIDALVAYLCSMMLDTTTNGVLDLTQQWSGVNYENKTQTHKDVRKFKHNVRRRIEPSYYLLGRYFS